ncbi:50S ribosomal protein L15 [ANME-1 cluster archaeon GoMg2]|nr:50S ribosomal protein L15 [ANME-1 cluster archaeon GoMg2]
MKKRVKRIRGTRTCGGGSAKKRRGKGSKGGSGKAGAYGHHFVWSLKRGISKGHNKSATSREQPGDKIVINVGELEDMLEGLIAKGKAEERTDGFFVDLTPLGIQKVLGKGQVEKKWILKANEISQIAKDKIESAGGTVELATGV